MAYRYLFFSAILISGLVMLTIAYAINQPTATYFFVFFVLMFIVLPPKYVISPLTILYIYYGLWFFIAPLFAQRYSEVSNSIYYSYSFLLSFITLSIGVIFLHNRRNAVVETHSNAMKEPITFEIPSKSLLTILFLLATLFVVLIVVNSGGLGYWINSPGEAFLNRSGTGLYVVGSRYISLALASLCGYYAFLTKKRTVLYIFFFWLLLTSPVHGSKFQISLLLVMSLIPWLKDLPFFSKGSFLLGVVFICILFLGLYFRNLSWMTWNELIPYTLNYFDTLDNLSISLNDFPAGFNETFFMPFNKFMTPLGNEGGSIFYDMSQWLTSIYDPKAWDIRATIQFPIETDMYLNFYYFLGIPILALFFFINGRIYSMARSQQHLGAWFAAVLMTLLMISHLRGSIYNHTDFYIYPYVFIMYFCLRKYKFPRKDKVNL